MASGAGAAAGAGSAVGAGAGAAVLMSVVAGGAAVSAGAVWANAAVLTISDAVIRKVAFMVISLLDGPCGPRTRAFSAGSAWQVHRNPRKVPHPGRSGRNRRPPMLRPAKVAPGRCVPYLFAGESPRPLPQ